MHRVEKENWIYIAVPAIIDEALFDVVQEQLKENKKLFRVRERGTTHLLQGLVVCKICHYAFYGKNTNKKNIKRAYYRCTGSDASRFGSKICSNKPVRSDILEYALWEEVKSLLKDPDRIRNEYQSRMSNLEVHQFLLWWAKTNESWTYQELVMWFVEACWDIYPVAHAAALLQSYVNRLGMPICLGENIAA